MPYLNQIKVSNTVYDIQDSNALPKAGGTMTGNLIADNNSFVAKTTIDPSVTPSSSLYTNGYYFNNINGDDIGALRMIYGTNQSYVMYLYAARNINDTSYINYLRMSVQNDGAKKVLVSEPEEWRNALGASSGIFPVSVGGTGKSTVSDFMRDSMNINHFILTPNSSGIINYTNRTNSLIVIFWMRQTTYGIALSSGYNDNVYKVVDSNTSSPTITNNTTTHKITITNNRSSNVSFLVLGGSLDS